MLRTKYKITLKEKMEVIGATLLLIASLAGIFSLFVEIFKLIMR